MLTKRCSDILALSLIEGLGPVRIKNILGDSSSDIPVTYSGEIKKVKESGPYEKEMSYIEQEEINVICSKDEKYPNALKNIYDPPSVLFYKGEILPQDGNAIAIVGSRKCSLYGLRMAERLAYDLALAGITVVSGMARGIDSAAHRGAIKAGGRTIAVTGSGFRHMYPPEAKELERSIRENGTVVTEYTSDTMPSKTSFPRRNRIISGIAKGVIVVEAAKKSGAMITVDFALEQGREVFAVPGCVDSVASGGTNFLIQNGAKLVTCVDDVLSELNLDTIEGEMIPVCASESTTNSKHTSCLEQTEQKILDLLSKDDPEHVDLIYEKTEIEFSKLPEWLLKMEIKGLVKALPGKHYVLN